MRASLIIALAIAAGLGGCAAWQPHTPPFARKPYEAFSRTNAIAIALDEWRLFGERVDDDDDARYTQTAATMAERQPGLWERIGEYWWEGLNPGSPESGWTGKHNAQGNIFPVAVNGRYAWSAAFISYVMRIAGAGKNFPYAADHAFYINYAARAAQGKISNPLLIAQNPATTAPTLGDLVCLGRGAARNLSFANLPTAQIFPAHCSLVVAQNPDQITVIGGNVEDAVTKTHIPTTQGLIGPPWFVILHVIYSRP